jgi:RNA polymerase sigma-70 factor, ECF subfamily
VGVRYPPSRRLDSLDNARFQAVLEETKAGTDWAIVALYRWSHPRLLRYLRAQEPAEGEDLAAETWIDAARALHRFRGDERAFQRWIFTIARRRLIDFRRRRGRAARAHRDWHNATEPREHEDAGAPVLEASETEAALALIASLSPDQAEVVLLRVVAGFDVDEVATMLGKRPGTVRVLQHRALRRLAEQLAREGAGVTR